MSSARFGTSGTGDKQRDLLLLDLKLWDQWYMWDAVASCFPPSHSPSPGVREGVAVGSFVLFLSQVMGPVA